MVSITPLGSLPDGVAVRERARGPLDVILLFVKGRAELERRFERLAAALDPAGGLWVAWPKKSSGVETDLDQARVMEIGLERGLVDNKMCAIDETWSGLRFRDQARGSLAESRSATSGSSQKRAISRDSRPPCQASGDAPWSSLTRRALGSRSA
jgi:hypothetical protein